MKFKALELTCPICRREIGRKSEIVLPKLERWLIRVINKDNPDWIEEKGICPRCMEFYRARYAHWIKQNDA